MIGLLGYKKSTAPEKIEDLEFILRPVTNLILVYIAVNEDNF